MVLPRPAVAPPTVALPAVTLIPHQIPLDVAAPLEEYKANPPIVLLWINEFVPPAVNAQFMAIYLVVFAFVVVTVYALGKVPVTAVVLPSRLVVPVPAALAKPSQAIQTNAGASSLLNSSPAPIVSRFDPI